MLVQFLFYAFSAVLIASALGVITLRNPVHSALCLVVSFFSGVQLLALGLVGEYIGRIYDETKRRPMYIVDRKINFSEGAASNKPA